MNECEYGKDGSLLLLRQSIDSIMTVIQRGLEGGGYKSSVLDTLILRPNMVEVVAKHVTIDRSLKTDQNNHKHLEHRS